MKRYIRSDVKSMGFEHRTLEDGAYLLNRQGILIDTVLHVPSTTYQNRDIYHLCPTDAEFLLNNKLISEEEAISVLLYCFIEYLRDMDKSEYDIMDSTKFSQYAELRYAPKLRKIFMSRFSFDDSVDDLEYELQDYPDFNAIDDKWYTYLQNHYVKVSKFGNHVEFRIYSNGFNWNTVIIDNVILNDAYGLSECTFTIAKEQNGKYRLYFDNADVNDILEHDDIVLSTHQYRRKVVNKQVVYKKIP